MRISIFGLGYVGTVSSACFAALGHTIIGVDLASERVAAVRRGRSPIVEPQIDLLIADAASAGRLTATDGAPEAIQQTDLSLICVGTPSAEDGSVSLREIDSVIAAIGDAIAAKSSPHVVVMRSTVPPGSAKSRVIPVLEQRSGRRLGAGLSYYSNPEFLREGCAVADFYAPPFTLFGAFPGDRADILRELYETVQAPQVVTSFRIAESVKYLSNTYHAVKIAFANEAGAILSAHGVNSREAFRVFHLDQTLNISPAYLQPGFAFGGSCLPKEVRSFLALARSSGVAAPFLDSVLSSNQSVIERALDKITSFGRGRISLFGLAFKAGTDDLRESPFVVLAERLLGKGYDLRIFDSAVRRAMQNARTSAYIENHFPHLAHRIGESARDVLDGSSLAVIGHVASEDRPGLVAALREQTVIDLAGIPELATVQGVEYLGFCW